MEYRWLSAASSHPGNVRRLNEDAHLCKPESGLWVVADGMGGHSAGDYASGMIVAALAEASQAATLEARIADVSQKLLECNASLFEAARERGVRIIGSTVVALLACGRRAACVWAGDSRAYRLRDGALTQLTQDHSRVQEMIAEGTLSIGEARNHPQGNVVTRAVGASDILALEQKVFDVVAGDTFLLCSDGLTGELEDADIARLLADSDSRRCVDALLDEALAGRARDNVTVVVAHVHDDAPTALLERDAPAERERTADRTVVRGTS